MHRRQLFTLFPPVKVNAVTLWANKTSLCAGGLASDVHRTNVVAVVYGTDGRVMRNRSVLFSWDPPGPVGLQQSRVNTNDSGAAFQLVTSGDEPGSFEVRAECETKQATPLRLLVEAPQDAWRIQPDELVADGKQEASVRVSLALHGAVVPGHRLEWKIIRAYDAQGVEVKPDAHGVFPGYGHFIGVNSTTGNDGVALNSYVAGTKPGSVVFEATDLTWFEKFTGSASSSSAQVLAAARRRGRYIKEATWSSGASYLGFGPDPQSPLGFIDVNEAKPQVLIVPQGDNAHCNYEVRAREDVRNLTFQHGTNIISQRAVLDAYEGIGRFTVKGLKPGTTKVYGIVRGQYASNQWLDSVGVRATLKVEVKRVRTIRLNFYLCQNRRYRTGRGLADLNRIVHEMNTIWRPQAGVVFVRGDITWHPVSDSLGAKIPVSALPSIMNDRSVIQPTKPDVRNVYFVWDIEGDVLGETPDFGHHLFSRDSATFKQGQILAHEAGHSFDLRHPQELVTLRNAQGQEYQDETFELSKRHDRLMHPWLLGGQRLSYAPDLGKPSEINTVNPTPNVVFNP